MRSGRTETMQVGSSTLHPTGARAKFRTMVLGPEVPLGPTCSGASRMPWENPRDRSTGISHRGPARIRPSRDSPKDEPKRDAKTTDGKTTDATGKITKK